MGISPHHDLLTRLPARLKLRSVAASTAPAGRGLIFSGSSRDADVSPRRFLAWVVLAILFAVGFAPASAASELPALRPWPQSPTTGPLHAFTLDDLNGAPRRLQDFAGNVVVLHFFATWCEPCVREITSLRTLASLARDKPLKIVAVDVAEVNLRVRAFFEKLPVDFPVLLDRDRAVTRGWQVSALPSTYVLAPDLTPRFVIEGDLDWTHPDVLAILETLNPAKAGDATPSAPRPSHITAITINKSPEETSR